MRLARWLAIALLGGCASAPPRHSAPYVHLAVGPDGVVRSDSWRGEYPPQPQVSCPLELARVRIRESGACESELTVTLGTLVVRATGEVLLDERRVAAQAQSVHIEQLEAGGHPGPMNYDTAEKVGQLAQNLIMGIGAFATFGLLVAFSDPHAPLDVSAGEQ